jgi:WD40 repeat protein
MHRFAISLLAVALATAPAVLPSDTCRSLDCARDNSTPSIAFASKRDGNWEIHLASLDGTRHSQLTARGGQTRFPLWGPDGTKLAFGVQGSATWELWVMNADELRLRWPVCLVAGRQVDRLHLRPRRLRRPVRRRRIGRERSTHHVRAIAQSGVEAVMTLRTRR